MIVTIRPGPLRGQVSPPPSKSHAQRLLMAAALSQGETLILRPGTCGDVETAVRCLGDLGVPIRQKGDALSVTGLLPRDASAQLNCGESGAALRFLLPLCALGADRRVTFRGEGRLPDRPLLPLLNVLRAHGARVEGDALPLGVGGSLRPGDYALPGDISSQFFSGLLLALPLLPSESILHYTSPLQSRPYVDMTLSVLRQFGVRAEEIENGWRVPGGQSYRSPGPVETEADWSAAAFWLGADALGGRVEVRGMNPDSRQGDRRIGEMLSRIGGEIDVSQTPDLLPVLSAVAAAAPGAETRFTGGKRLRIKESDRLAAMAQMIRDLGGEAWETEDGLTVRGNRLRGGTIDGQNDHRVIMSAAVLATICEGPVTIPGAEAVSKSYPGFWNDFEALGGCVHVR